MKKSEKLGTEMEKVKAQLKRLQMKLKELEEQKLMAERAEKTSISALRNSSITLSYKPIRLIEPPP